MSKFIVAIDPSYTRSGICIIKDKSIYFHTASEKIGEKQFANVVKAAQTIVKQIKEIVLSYGDDFDLIHEEPLPNSSMSAALYCLDSLLYTEFEPHIVKTYNPATLRSKIHGHKYDKTDSVNLADKYLKVLTDNGYTINMVLGKARKIPHDCCEAFLYAHLYLHDNGVKDFQFDNADEIAAFKMRQKELKRREKLLLSDREI